MNNNNRRLFFLQGGDFSIEHENNAINVMRCPFRGLSLIMFYSTRCGHCIKLVPKFKELPNMINGIQFGMINVTENQDVIGKSRGTTTELKYVPVIFLYYNGRPFMRYDGPPELAEISRFIAKEAQRLNQNDSFSSTQKSRKTIPTYSIGVPLCQDDDLYYLDYKDAYSDV